MAAQLVVGVSGNLTRPSKTRVFIEHIAGQVAKGIGAASATFDTQDLGPSFGQARRLSDLDPAARNLVEQLSSADVLVVGSPTFKGSYTGLFKHFFDLLDPLSLKGKPVVLAATGGGERHSLIVEHQLRPLFGFFEALTIPTAIYASDKDFADGVLISEAVRARAQQAVSEACRLAGGRDSVNLAA
jgi:FMN reductase